MTTVLLFTLYFMGFDALARSARQMWRRHFPTPTVRALVAPIFTLTVRRHSGYAPHEYHWIDGKYTYMHCDYCSGLSREADDYPTCPAAKRTLAARDALQ